MEEQAWCQLSGRVTNTRSYAHFLKLSALSEHSLVLQFCGTRIRKQVLLIVLEVPVLSCANVRALKVNHYQNGHLVFRHCDMQYLAT